jgi:hypothetical protein
MAACDDATLQQEQNGDKIQISLSLYIGDSPLSVGGSMAGTKGTGDALFEAIYEGIVSGEIVAAYELTFTNKSSGASTIFNGRWNDGKTISLEKGEYTISGECTASGNGIYNQCSLTMQDEVSVTEQTTSIRIKAQYDCSLLILNDETVDRVLYYANQNDSAYFAKYKNLTYAFLKSSVDFTQGGSAFLKVYFKNGKSSIIELGQINIQKGMYYLLENLNNYADAGLALDIDKMQNGDDYNQIDFEPKPISFAVSDRRSTRATNIDSFDKYLGTFSVWITKIPDNDASSTPVVVLNGENDNSLITYDESKMEPNHWTYAPYRYWDKMATYAFVAVSPNANIIKYNKPENVADNSGKFVTADATGYTLIGQNLQSSTSPAESEIQYGFKGGNGEDTDLMTSYKVHKTGANGVTGDVNLEFKHILSKLNIAIAKDPTFDNVKVLIKSVRITGLDDTGTYVEDSSNTERGWTTSSNNRLYTLSWENTNGVELPKGTGEGDSYQAGKYLYFIESLVMPQSIETNNEKLVIVYTIESGTHSENYTYTLNLHDSDYSVYDNFMDGNKYTIKFTVRPNVITFDASIEAWTYETQNYTVLN